LEGILEIWYDNGQLKKKCKYVNGKLEGTLERWDDNGALLKSL
jgi:antitoxin component YwqK of YwqJK toxin-antitoxin module